MNLVYEGDYFGLDEWWYNVGGTKASDYVSDAVEGAKKSASESVQSVTDTVTAPFRYIQENTENIKTVMYYAFWGFVVIGGLYIIVSMQKLLQAIGIYQDVKKLVGAVSSMRG